MKTKKISSNVKPSKKKTHPFWSFFWLSFLVVSLWYVWYSFYEPSNEIKWVNVSNQESLINNSNKYAIVFFTAEWCSPCRIMKREVFADQKVEEMINSKYRAIMIDIDNPETKDIVNQYKAYATPTTLLIDPNGKVIEHIVGKIEKDKFLQMLLNI
ncbi:Thioredoxin-like domain-containing protein [Aquimarina amphilecti]|uniref:Thioredoxin-like domain-containing protein n=1 Tax=Aquimarina amphilecti TaxID=1038014 RepID=A0A1H7HBE0_AQUAM|nr:thioredoxin fold domain-containing protein [Aquimarina amphilecti]SEK46662.1 Thioredoxin-like domain-containing protein [Aquimarina amphilecti]